MFRCCGPGNCRQNVMASLSFCMGTSAYTDRQSTEQVALYLPTEMAWRLECCVDENAFAYSDCASTGCVMGLSTDSRDELTQRPDDLFRLTPRDGSTLTAWRGAWNNWNFRSTSA